MHASLGALHLTSTMFSHDRLLYHAFSALSSALLTIFRFFSPDTTPNKGKTLKRTFDATPTGHRPPVISSFQITRTRIHGPESPNPVKQHPAQSRIRTFSVACRLICHDFLFCQIKNRKKMKKSWFFPRKIPETASCKEGKEVFPGYARRRFRSGIAWYWRAFRSRRMRRIFPNS